MERHEVKMLIVIIIIIIIIIMVTLEQATKAQRGRGRCILYPFFNLGSRWGG